MKTNIIWMSFLIMIIFFTGCRKHDDVIDSLPVKISYNDIELSISIENMKVSEASELNGHGLTMRAPDIFLIKTDIPTYINGIADMATNTPPEDYPYVVSHSNSDWCKITQIDGNTYLFDVKEPSSTKCIIIQFCPIEFNVRGVSIFGIDYIIGQ